MLNTQFRIRMIIRNIFLYLIMRIISVSSQIEVSELERNRYVRRQG